MVQSLLITIFLKAIFIKKFFCVKIVILVVIILEIPFVFRCKICVNTLKMINKKIFIVQLVLLLLTGSKSIAQLEINAMLRSRFELRNGYQKPEPFGSQPAAFITQRTRLNMNYITNNLKFKFSPQDVRVWGDEQISSLSGVGGDNASIDMFEGFAEIRLWSNNWISAGRQIITYDNQWLLSKGDWSQNGASYDAVVFKFTQSGYTIHAGSMWNTFKERSSNNFYQTDRYKTVNYIWAHHNFTETGKISFLHITSGQTKSDTSNTIYFRHTTGFYGTMQFSNTFCSANIYHQFGKNQTGKRVSAYLIYLDIKQETNFVNFELGGNILSGNKVVDTTMLCDNLFDPIYTSRHTYFGNIDYFRKFDTDTKQGGLIDVFAAVSAKPIKGFSLKNCVHLFFLEQTNSKTPSSKYLGLENDFVVGYRFAEWGVAELGFLSFFQTKAHKELLNISDCKTPTFTYLQLIITPVLFKQKNINDAEYQ